MLDELHIRGLGVIEDALLPLRSGLTVVTGETGAGKTMVVTGLLLLFGGRADAARIRAGSSQATVDGRVSLPAGSAAARRVEAAGGEVDDGELLLRRAVHSSGRSRAHVGGTAAPVGVLAELAEELLVVHGQSDQQRLVRAGAQRSALDRFAGIDTAQVSAAYAAWRAAAADYDERTTSAAQLRRESDLLAHGIAEIEAAEPQPGETTELTRAAARLAAADALRLAARAAHDALLGDPADPGVEAADVTTLLGGAARALSQLHGSDETLDALTGRVAELASLATDLGAELGAYAEHLDADPERLAQIEARRAVLAALVRKYCDDPEPSLEGVLDWADAARTRLADIDVSDEALEALRAGRDAAAATLDAAAARVTTARADAAARLSQAVTTELAGLAMADAALEITVEARAVGPDGADEVTFLLRPHPGAPALPLARGASGGELSRVMLALEVCLITAKDGVGHGADAETVTPAATLVFDEVDAGVGGRAAVEVGRRLARLASGGGRQVLVVTHLPQVAAYADHHLVVDKPSSGTQAVTSSDVRVVDGEHRVTELARMLAGSDTSTAREHAAELLAECAADLQAPPARSRARVPRRRAG